jgi:hypothetical protein
VEEEVDGDLETEENEAEEDGVAEKEDKLKEGFGDWQGSVDSNSFISYRFIA